MHNFKENVILANYTTIKLGGTAKYFCECKTEKELVDCLKLADEKQLKTHILGGGSNTVFSDSGFDGLVIKTGMKGIELHNDFKDNVIIKVSAGEEWDDFVKYCVENKYSGVECLSGIPGSAGASPIQNIGAYGQEVKDTIIFVKALDRKTCKSVMFANEDCLFGYRTSRFKNIDKEKYIVTEVLFKLKKDGNPEIKYPELEKKLNEKYKSDLSLSIVRNVVIELRKKKAMVVDESEPDSVSCGSFFVNLVLSETEFQNFYEQIENGKWPAVAGANNAKTENSEKHSIPFYKTSDGVKLSAAWLIENAGFKKGYTKNGAGISAKHSLALVNRGGTTADLLKLAKEIQEKVFEKFRVKLIREPEVI
ncbi:MAG: UDP-N-acetylmuramate dehydrogenase [Ignavibacteriae bacterium]|nr:UDP-N-acetylmuramate dehydrogenase [Ignavibacteriota bacterium]